jgi:putative FmdB family regulatory protein
MPLYEYQCDACGREFERIRKFSDPPLEKCPHCGGAVRKLFSSPAIQFKGSGFYITDYAKKELPAAQSGETKSETSTDKDTGEKRGDKSDKSDKAEKGEKSGTSEKGEKSGKTEKSEKTEKRSKDEKTSSKSDATSPKAPGPSKDSK